MNKKYDHKKIENKWQKKWEKEQVYKDKGDDKEPRFYVLDMFPYPSGDGLHVGHPKGYTATDIYARFLRANGYNVIHPMGWDAFGLPAENYAIKTGTHPEITTQKNIDKIKSQIKSIGFSYDWDRVINTTDPNYYKWTQWIFLKLFEKGLAYESEAPINWCPSCKTGLANEEVVAGGKCERCGATVEKKSIRQWILKITEYADRLLDDLKDLDWPKPIIEMQKNWIGKSEGAEVEFSIKQSALSIKVYTTRPDTLFGCTYMVLAPEHPLVSKLGSHISNLKEVEKYIKETAKKSDIERQVEEKEKTGVELKGVKAINPVNNEEIPVFIADYVMLSYGTGAIMAVPAHDERDYEFAKKFKLPIIEVIKGGDIKKEAFTGDGVNVNSEFLNGLKTSEAVKKMIEWLEKDKVGRKAVNYKLRDWIFSRQRYWGEPIPLIHCEKCGVVPVPENELPLELPKVEKYEPTGTGESPLASIEDWVNTKCPKCGGDGKRETNTMPQWAGSCWYFLRFIDPKNDKALADPKKLKAWLPVDLYVGGAEHAVLHLLYSRFWHKVLYDLKVVPTKEPFQKLLNQGMILAEDGKKMSKSLGNVINPDDVVNEYGADTFRTYEMFMGPFSQEAAWSTSSIEGVHRFLTRVWNLSNSTLSDKDDPEMQKILHQTIKKVTEDIKSFDFNTAISQMMVFVNETTKKQSISKNILEQFIIILSPFAPHLCEEIWCEILNNKFSVTQQAWPKYDEKLAAEEEIELVVQVNGKVRDKIMVPADIKEAEVKKLVYESEKIKKWTEGKKIVKEIFIQGKLYSIVVK